jgi:TonB-linked SusC/RagA family outer membrane protein
MKKKTNSGMWMRYAFNKTPKIMQLTLFFLLVSLHFTIVEASKSSIQVEEIQEQDKKTVIGTVTDVKGEPIPGVSIVIMGTTNGTVADKDGNFTLPNVSNDDVLTISFIGMRSVEVAVKEQSRFDIALQSELVGLDEVVVVGFGEQKKISVVGAQSNIKVGELQQPTANISTMLAGRVSGLTGVQRSGLPGHDAADIWIRGISTFDHARPLILVDGVERSMDGIDPIDIESFAILKDAAATAVYGVRGANGVILIETKRGKIGKPSVKVDYFEGVTSFTKTPELADGLTYMQLANEALTTRGGQPKYSEEYMDRTASNYDPLLYPNVNWLKEVFNDFGRNRKATVNLSGGSPSAQYYVSVGYYDETGLFVTDGLESYDSDTRYKRYTITTNLTVDITKSTKVDLGIRGSLSDGTFPANGVSSIFEAAMEAPPVEYPVLYPGGFVPGKSANGGLRNPYADVAKRGYKDEIGNTINSNLRLTQDLSELTQGLQWTGMFAFDANNSHNIIRSKREDTYFVDMDYPYTRDGELILVKTFSGNNYLGYTRENGGNRRFYTETAINYNRDFNQHTLGGLLLFNRSDYVNAFAGDFTGSIPYRNQGFAGRLTYGYDNRYFVEVNAGYNGSENFSPDNRYGFFPSMAFGWVISNEKFFIPLSNTINHLKIRYSDGKVGAESGAGRFAYMSRVQDDQDGFDFGETTRFIGGIRETYYGVDVTWATSRKQDIGIELNAFNSGLRLIFDVFKENTSGAFLQLSTIPNYVGLSTDPYGNIGETENKGFDGTLELNKQFTNDFSLAFKGTFSYNKSKIIENGQPPKLYPWLDQRNQPLNASYGLVAERLYTLADDVNGDGFITPADGDYPTQYGQIMPGDIKYTDLNKDGQIDSYDIKNIGNGDIPPLTYGFGVSTRYKGFDLSLFFQGQHGADMLMSGKSIQPFLGDGGEGNLYAFAKNRWTLENDDPYALYPRLSYSASGIGQSNNTQASTWWQREVDFLRLKTAELGYNLPETLISKYGIENIRLYMRGTNLLTFSDFDLWDPELTTSRNGGAYPNTKVISLGVNINF